MFNLNSNNHCVTLIVQRCYICINKDSKIFLICKVKFACISAQNNLNFCKKLNQKTYSTCLIRIPIIMVMPVSKCIISPAHLCFSLVWTYQTLAEMLLILPTKSLFCYINVFKRKMTLKTQCYFCIIIFPKLSKFGN